MTPSDQSGTPPAALDTSKPNVARAYDYLLGGKDSYAADQEAVRQILRTWPEVRDIALANRAFTQRAVRFLAGEAGIRQFIDIGTGIPSAGKVHEVAGQVAPGARVVYVDNDPIVHVHASALLCGSDTTAIVLADLRDPGAILAYPKLRELIDFSQPVGLLLVAILHSSRRGRTRPGSWPRCGTRCRPAVTSRCPTERRTSIPGCCRGGHHGLRACHHPARSAHFRAGLGGSSAAPLPSNQIAD
jgi:S-adenosyl methyltransferase